MKKHSKWVLFGFGDALADIIDVMASNDQFLSKVVLNIEVDQEHLERYLALYKQPVEVIELEKFEPRERELYNFGFFVPEKKQFAEKLHPFGLNFTNLIHKSASMSTFASYGEGLLIGPQVVVTACSSIGNHIRLNRSVTIGHHCIIEDYVHIGPSVTIAGYCNIGEGTFIGAGSVLKDHINIGKNTLIGAGSVVVNDIPDDVIAFGVPAKVKREINQNMSN